MAINIPREKGVMADTSGDPHPGSRSDIALAAVPNGNGRKHMTEQNAYTMSQEAKKESLDPSPTAPQGHVLNNQRPTTSSASKGSTTSQHPFE